MSVVVSVNGTNFTIPENSNTNWGTSVTAWMQSVSANTLQKSGGSFVLTAELDFGSTYGVKLAYVKSKGTNPAGSGFARLGNSDSISWRDSGNTSDQALQPAADGLLQYVGKTLVDVSTAQTLTNKTLTAPAITAPTGLTKNDVGLGNVDNTSDASKNAATAVLTNKDIDGGTASNVSRITLPKAAKTVLDGLTRKAGTIVYATDLLKSFIDNGTSLTAIGSGSGSGGINYVTNPDAETDTSGWSTYADAAQATPVDGTGGTPTVAFGRSTVSPLRGLASFLFAKPSGSAQGQGVSTPLTIDQADLGKVLTVSMNVLPSASSTYATGDLAVWVYDVTNAALIPVSPSPIELTTASGGSVFRGTFQVPTTSQSFRLCFHVASANATAWTMTIDNVIVGPQAIVNGTPVTDPADYVPIVTGLGTGTVSTVNYSKWARDGKFMHVYGRLTINNGTGGGSVAVSLPPGYSIDFPGATGSAQLSGSGGYINGAATTTNSALRVTAVLGSPSSIYFVRQAGTAEPFLGGSDFGTGNGTFWYDIWLPIVGWSSNVQMSSDSDTRVITATAGLGATSVPSGTFTKLNFASAISDKSGMVDLSNGRLKVLVPGTYQLIGLVNWSPPSASTHRAWGAIYKNGNLVWESGQIFPATTNGVLHSVTMPPIDAIAGDYFELWFRQDIGSTATMAAYGYFAATRVSGPSQIAATEAIRAKYQTAAGQVIPNATNTIVNFGSKDSDTHGAVTTGASWKFTAPTAGSYSVDTFLFLASGAGWDAGEQLYIELWKNGVYYSFLDVYTQVGTNSSGYQLKGNDTLDLLPGDYLHINIFQNSGAARALNASASQNRIFIRKNQ